MSAQLVNEEQLKAWLKIEQRATLEKYLRERGVKIFHGKGGCICTTVEAINGALLGNINASNNAESSEDFDFV